MTAVSESERPRRRDAERNRETILAAARAVFAEAGLAAGVDRIARRAGVGPGTLYRHFPSKAALVDAVLDDSIAALRDVVRGAGEVPDPAVALRELVHRIVDVQIADRSFRDLLAWHDASSAREVPELAELGELIGGIVGRARAAGALRADATPEDVLLALIALDGVSGSAGARAPDAVHRLADVLVDGLLSTASPLAGDPLALEEFRAVAAEGRGLPVRASDDQRS